MQSKEERGVGRGGRAAILGRFQRQTVFPHEIVPEPQNMQGNDLTLRINTLYERGMLDCLAHLGKHEINEYGKG